jgi:acetolactate synthase regulatory subunit
MKQDFQLILFADNNFSVLNRILNILNRRRVRIRSLEAREDSSDIHQGSVAMVIHTQADMAEKVKVQIEKLIEVEAVSYRSYPGTLKSNARIAYTLK